MLAGILCLVVMLAAVVVYAFNTRSIQAWLISTLNPYDPARFGMPSYIAGYKVLAIFTPDNLACMNPGEIRLVLQTTEPNVGEYLANSNPKAIQKDLEHHGLDATKEWTYEIIGPDVTIEQIISESAKWNQEIKKTGCIRLGPAELPQTTIVTFENYHSLTPRTNAIGNVSR